MRIRKQRPRKEEKEVQECNCCKCKLSTSRKCQLGREVLSEELGLQKLLKGREGRPFKSSCRGSDEKFCAITVGSRKVLVEMCTFEHCGNILAALRVFIQ